MTTAAAATSDISCDTCTHDVPAQYPIRSCEVHVDLLATLLSDMIFQQLRLTNSSAHHTCQ